MNTATKPFLQKLGFEVNNQFLEQIEENVFDSEEYRKFHEQYKANKKALRSKIPANFFMKLLMSFTLEDSIKKSFILKTEGDLRNEYINNQIKLFLEENNLSSSEGKYSIVALFDHETIDFNIITNEQNEFLNQEINFDEKDICKEIPIPEEFTYLEDNLSTIKVCKNTYKNDIALSLSPAITFKEIFDFSSTTLNLGKLKTFCEVNNTKIKDIFIGVYY